MRLFTVCVLCFFSTMIVQPAAPAQVDSPAPPTVSTPHDSGVFEVLREVPDDPYVPNVPPGQRSTTSPAAIQVRNGFTSIQVHVDMWGLRGGQFGNVAWYEIATRDGLLPVPADWLGNPMTGAGLFGEERFTCARQRGVPWKRGKDFLAGAPLPFLGLATQPEYYTQIDVVLGILGTVRFGFNPGELIDFILGWSTLDIYRDDSKTLSSIQTAHDRRPPAPVGPDVVPKETE